MRFFSRITAFFRAVGVFWPSVALVALLFITFCVVDMGRDLVLYALEKRWGLPVTLTAMVFAAFTVWYSARILGYFFLRVLAAAPWARVHLPRFMGFSVFTVMALAFTIPPIAVVPVSRLLVMLGLYVVSYQWYLFLVRKAKAYAKKHRDAAHARKGLSFLLIALLVVCLLPAAWPKAPVMVACILLAQMLYTLQVGVRKEWAPLLDTSRSLTMRVLGRPAIQRLIAAAGERLAQLGNTEAERPRLAEEVVFFTAFNGIALVALGLFIAADTSLAFAQLFRPLPIVITGLGVMRGALNLLRLAGRLYNVNVFFWMLVVALLFGHWFDAHEVRHVEAGTTEQRKEQDRPTFEQAARDWMLARIDTAAQDSLASRPPMIFVLSDGGGARSARWVASVLARLDSTSNGRFRNQLFCLSGASGGSVGNTVYYGLLRNNVAASSIAAKCDTVLGADLLSFTLARMLGNDLLNLCCPLLGAANGNGKRLLEDRAAAVEDGLTRAAGEVGLDLNATTAQWMRQDVRMPLLCINTTRMQDARPAVIASFRLTGDKAFNERVDVLAEMEPARTLRVSSSAILSARFPYVTPAGGIPMVNGAKQRVDQYVDGGYFDNSGAGLVLEMLAELEWNDSLRPLFRRFRPVIIHISNGDPSTHDPGHVNSVANDLLAPVVTIIGSYGEQTDVNNRRLERYLANRGMVWSEVNLFKGSAIMREYYPMSWVMSQAPKDSMRVRVRTHPELQLLEERLRARLP